MGSISLYFPDTGENIMPPRKKGKKYAAAAAAAGKKASRAETPPTVNDIERDDSEPGEADILEHAHPDTEGSQKKKRVYNNVTDEQEELLVNWLKDNPILYNKGLKEYKNKEKKTAMWTDKAQQLDIIGIYTLCVHFVLNR